MDLLTDHIAGTTNQNVSSYTDIIPLRKTANMSVESDADANIIDGSHSSSIRCCRNSTSSNSSVLPIDVVKQDGNCDGNTSDDDTSGTIASNSNKNRLMDRVGARSSIVLLSKQQATKQNVEDEILYEDASSSYFEEPITICIGYIFASKKMNTMSVEMAESSKVRLGILLNTGTRSITPTTAATTTGSGGSHTVSPSSVSACDESESHSSRCATITPVSKKNDNMHEKTFVGTDPNSVDTSGTPIDSSNFGSNQFTLTQARLLTHEAFGKPIHHLLLSDNNNNNIKSDQNKNSRSNKRNMYGSKNKKSCYNGSSTSTETATSATTSLSTTTYFSDQRQQASLSLSSQSSVTTGIATTTMTYEIPEPYQTIGHGNNSLCGFTTSNNLNTRTLSTSSCTKLDTLSTTDCSNSTLIESSPTTILSTTTTTLPEMTHQTIIPLRISFVPLDDTLPFHEQHSGKIDIILHKLTEDIVNASQQLLLTQQSKPSSSSPTQNDSDTNDERKHQQTSMERIQRLLDYNQQQSGHSNNGVSAHHNNAGSCLVDHPLAVRKVMCRAEIANTLQQCLKNVQTLSGIPVRTPKYAILQQQQQPSEVATTSDINNNQHSITVAKALQPQLHDLSFPIIVKPLVAAGTKSSHAMTIIMKNGYHNKEALLYQALKATPEKTHMDDLQQLGTILQDKYPCLCQEYSNHDAKLYKVYVLGDYISVHQRRSLPNLPTLKTSSTAVEGDASSSSISFINPTRTDDPTTTVEITGSSTELQLLQDDDKAYTCVEFDSQRPYPHLSDFGYSLTDCVTSDANNPTIDLSDDTDAVEVTVEEVRPIVNVLKQAFQLDLFGFDVLITMVPKESVGVETTGTVAVIPNHLAYDESTNTAASTLNRRRHANRSKMMLVVDVNYFPSYKEVTNFPSLLAQYLAQRALARQQA